MPLKAEIANAYQDYSTHGNVPSTPVRVAYEILTVAFLQRRYGYKAGPGPPWHRHLWPLAYLLPGGTAELEAGGMFLRAPVGRSTLLDVGCGNGEVLTRLSKMGWDVEGVEVDPAAVSVARGKGLSVRLGPLEAQGYSDSAFDAIYMNHVIEHVHDPLSLLTECRRILKPGGTLVVVTPNSVSWGHHHFGRDWRGLEPPRHLYLFDRRNLRHAAERSGLSVVRQQTTAKGVRYIAGMSLELRRRRIRGSRPAPKAAAREAKGLPYQILERLLGIWQPDAGDEILLLATKVDSPNA